MKIDEDVTGLEIDRAVKGELRTLSKDNAQGVGQHLIMVARLIDDDIETARAHADAAVRRAGRVPSVREARGMVAYQEGDWNVALSEFRTARRLSGSDHLLPYLVDCERALGRADKALELALSPEADALPAPEKAEIAIVVSGIRRDMGQAEAALQILEGRHLVPGRTEVWAPRMYYAYADALLDLGRTDEARTWFHAAADVDADLQTDAWERLDELDGTVVVDLLEGEDDDEDLDSEQVAVVDNATDAGSDSDDDSDLDVDSDDDSDDDSDSDEEPLDAGSHDVDVTDAPDSDEPEQGEDNDAVEASDEARTEEDAS